MSDDTNTLSTDSKYRKTLPLATGVLDYFPAALAEVARLSRAGNEKHNPGQPLHHARGKSSDHADCILRHLVDRGNVDPEDGFLHDVKVAWRALALLQEALEARGAPMARGARPATPAEPEKGEVWRQNYANGTVAWEFVREDTSRRPATPYEIDQFEKQWGAKMGRPELPKHYDGGACDCKL